MKAQEAARNALTAEYERDFESLDEPSREAVVRHVIYRAEKEAERIGAEYVSTSQYKQTVDALDNHIIWLGITLPLYARALVAAGAES